MSYMEFKMAKKDGEVMTLTTYKNAFGGVPFIWEEIFNKYLKNPQIPYDSWMQDRGKRLWEAPKDENIPRWLRVILLATFDRAIIEYNKLPGIAALYRHFITIFPPKSGVCHLPEWASMCESVYTQETENTCSGVCFYGGSGSADLWEIHDNELETCRPYDLSKDEEHWFVYEEMNKIEQEAENV